MAENKLNEWLQPEKLTLLEGWARNGLTDEQIAHNMGINRVTLSRWKKKNSYICNALKKNKEIADYIVENALFKSAVGFTEIIKKPIKIKEESFRNGKKTTKEKVIYVDEEVYYPPNVTAQIYWLKNRCPDKWRDRPQPVEPENTESDGLMEALRECASQIEDWEDDSWMLPEEETEGEDE